MLAVTILALRTRISLSLSLSELARSKSTLGWHHGTSTAGNVRTDLPESDFNAFHRGFGINRLPDAFLEAAGHLVHHLSHLLQRPLTGFVVFFLILILPPRLVLSIRLQLFVVAIIDVTRDCGKRLRCLMEMFLQSFKAMGSGEVIEGALKVWS